MLKNVRTLMSIACVIAILITAMFSSSSSVIAQITDSPSQGQIRINCGSVSGFIQEQYLYIDNGSNAETERLKVTSEWSSYGGGHLLTKRWADGTNNFTYRIPVNPSTPAPLYLSMVTKGEVKMSVNNVVMLNTGNSGEGDYCAREFTLSNSSVWSGGYIDVKFEDADPSDGWGPNIYWIEVGATSPWRERLKHIVWDTSEVVWQVGYYDGMANEFGGTATSFAVGGDISTLAKNGTIYLTWNSQPVSGKKYYLLTGIIGDNVTRTSYIDMKNDGSNEIIGSVKREKIFDLDVTSLMKYDAPYNNTVKITIPSQHKLDFAALVEVTDGHITDNDLRVVFKGNEMAQNWTKLANMTMYWNNEYMVDKGTGFVDASLPNGIFANSYWVADAAPAALEVAKWGYFDLAKQITNFKTAQEYYDPTLGAAGDNGAAGIMFATMAYLMKTDNYTGSYTDAIYPKMKQGLDYFCTEIDKTSKKLIMGNNWETTSYGYGIYNNSIAYFALLAGAEAAGKMGNTSDMINWNSHAEALLQGINTHLKLSNNISWLNKILPADTFRYAITNTGADVSNCHAGWFGVGSQEEMFYGYKGDAILSWRLAVDRMLDYHSSNFWADWKAYGHNRGFGTDYGVLSERGGWPVSAMLMGDRMDMLQKNLHHLIYNSTDLNFTHGNEGVQETSPWLLVREISKNDNGIVGADVGNGGEVEDMNLVEYIVTIKNVRLMAGIDDNLYGTNNLIIMPRVPKSWEGVKVNRWPVVYKKGSNYDKTDVSFDYSISPTKGSISVSAADSVSGVQFRFGPFEKNINVSSVTVNCQSISNYTIEDKGDAKWVWVTQDIGTSNKNITVNTVIPDMYIYDDFNDGDLTGWTESGGTWSNPDASARVVTTGDAWNTFGTEVSDLTLSGDVKIVSGNAVGLTFRNDGTGSSGYDLILDVVDGRLKLCKRPYVVLASMPVNVNRNRTYTLKVEAVGPKIKCYLDGGQAFEIIDRSYTSGKFGMFAYSSTSLFENVLAYKNAELVEDGGFEKQTSRTFISSPWLTEGPATNKGIDIGLGFSHSGKSNAFIRNNAVDTWNAFKQTIVVKPNTNYRLTGWIQNSNNIDYRGYFGVRNSDGSVNSEYNFGGLPNYTQLTVDFNSGSNTSMTIFAGFWSNGNDVWMRFDDISVVER